MRISDWSSDVCSSDLEDSVSGTATAVVMVIEVAVIGEVDEKLGGGGIWRRSARHGNGATLVLQPVVGLIYNRLASLLLVQVCGESAPLDDEEIGRASCRERVCQYV